MTFKFKLHRLLNQNQTKALHSQTGVTFTHPDKQVLKAALKHVVKENRELLKALHDR